VVDAAVGDHEKSPDAMDAQSNDNNIPSSPSKQGLSPDHALAEPACYGACRSSSAWCLLYLAGPNRVSTPCTTIYCTGSL